jgi:hypothetical protein
MAQFPQEIIDDVWEKSISKKLRGYINKQKQKA